MSTQPSNKTNRKPNYVKIPPDATDDQIHALAKSILVAWFGLNPQESPDHVSTKDRSTNTDEDEKPKASQE